LPPSFCGGFLSGTTTNGVSFFGGGGGGFCPFRWSCANTPAATMQDIVKAKHIRFNFSMITFILLMSFSHERAWEGEETRRL
jgi:hypothetical protein